MKTTLALAGIALALCSPGRAQENERVVVPARNTTRPRKVDVHLTHGAITVKAYSGKEVIVEQQGGRRRASNRPAEIDGMRRIDMPRGLTVEEQDNQITVRSSMAGEPDLLISVPPDTSLSLHTMQGAITVEGVKGEIEVDTMNGSTTMTGVSGNVLAHSMNGTLKVTMDAVDSNKPLSFTTMNGTIDVTLPADYKGNVKIGSEHGGVYSDFDFKLGGGTITTKNDTADGKFKVKIDKTMSGTINGGGPEATFKTFNGTIYIRKKK
jgi:hypothetical protein